MDDNSTAFEAKVAENCLEFIGDIVRVENVKAIFDGDAVGSAKRGEWIRRLRRREKVVRRCQQLVLRMKNKTRESRSWRSTRRLLQCSSRGAISFGANLRDKLATELGEMLSHHRINHTITIAQTECDEECAHAASNNLGTRAIVVTTDSDLPIYPPIQETGTSEHILFPLMSYLFAPLTRTQRSYFLGLQDRHRQGPSAI
jgi:hypothetical protein